MMKMFTAAVLMTAFLISPAAPVLAVDANYVIHSGDQLSVQVYGEPALTQTVTVLPDGTFAYPLVGRVHAAGQTPARAAAALAHSLTRYIRKPMVTVGVVSEGQITVQVLGNVKTTGKYLLKSNGRLLDAIAAAGGIGTTNGDFPIARVADADNRRQDVSLQKLMNEGDLSLNAPLADGAIVYVTGAVPITVEVVGAVDRPGEIALNEGDKLSMAIAKAGNSASSNADLNRIYITRKTADGQYVKYRVDLYRALEGQEPRFDIAMHKGDVVYVPEVPGGKRRQNPGMFLLLRRIIGL